MKLSEYPDNGSEIMPLNSPGGSSLLWGVGRALLRMTPFVLNVNEFVLLVSDE